MYTVHINDGARDAAERIELVREGFCFGALVFNGLWLLYYRLWMPFFIYSVLLGYLLVGAQQWGLGAASVALLQGGLNLLLAFSAHDIKRWALRRRGWRMVGVSIGDNELGATRRAYERWAV